MEESRLFTIAGHSIRLVFTDSSVNNMALLPSFAPFAAKADTAAQELLFTLTVDDSLRPAKNRKLVRKFDTGNGDTLVYQLSDGGYQYIIRDIYDRDCCLLICDSRFSNCHCALNGDYSMRSFGLNDALMLIFAFAGSFHHTLLVHASCVSHNGKAFPFIAKSGTGKSTHSSLWMKHIEGTELMNDDNPVVTVSPDGEVWLHGSPWSGKTPCYRNVKAPVGAMVRIERAPENRIERLKTIEAFASLLPACSSMKWDTIIYNNLCDAITRIVEKVPVYTLYCLPDEEAAHICQTTVSP
ncbi:MAG: hypothetical protein IJP74_11130 [Prevotella sp.]|nr:hypothetical protein [Prevotella sp.]